MAHDEIQTLADLTAAPVTLQHKLCTLKEQRRLGSMFLGSQLVQTPVQLFRNTQIHSHTHMVPNQYQLWALRQVCVNPNPHSPNSTKGPLSAFQKSV